MAILVEVRVRNFKCFRSEARIPLTQGTYLAGANNSGKTAILESLRCFFDDDAFRTSYINRTELTARKEGFNRSDITCCLDLKLVSGRERQRRMRKAYGDELEVRKGY